jgi:hypothetical protein
MGRKILNKWTKNLEINLIYVKVQILFINQMRWEKYIDLLIQNVE